MIAAAACAALVGWFVVETEARTRRAAFRIAKLETKIGDRENENAWLAARVAAARARVSDAALQKRAGFAPGTAPSRRVDPPATERLGS